MKSSVQPSNSITKCAVACFFFGIAANAEESPTALHFSWPVPSRVWVTETALKKDQTARLRYELVLTPDGRGKNLRLRFQNFSFLELAGADLKDPAQQKKIGQELALASAIPDLIISPQGEVKDVSGFDEMVTRVLAVLPDKEIRAGVEQMLKSPQMIQVMKQKCSEFWRISVSIWLDMEPIPQGASEVAQTIPMPDGSVVDSPTVVTHKGFDKSNPSNVILEMESVLEGEAPRKAMGQYLETLSKQNPPKNGKGFTADMLERTRRLTRIRVITDPKTMRPAFSSTETTNVLKVKGEPEASNVERREYRFDWK